MNGAGLPLSALLSQALVAFAIELDNEFEHRAPHSTTRHASTGGPWLTSVAMWFTCMRYVDRGGISIRDLHAKARMGTNLDGMRRWGYIAIEPKRPKVDSILRPTEKGEVAREVWAGLFEVVERRWEKRFDFLPDLRRALREAVEYCDPVLPDYMPILGYGLWTIDRERPPATGPVNSDLPLISLLAKPLIALAENFERESDVSLAISANVLRVIDGATEVKTLPHRSGVSKEAIATALGFLEKRGFAQRSKFVELTPKGAAGREKYFNHAQIQSRDHEAVTRSLLEPLQPRLFEGLEPYSDSWRAAVPRPSTLPHYPMVLHRGGYPDGS